jgi:hypothetical protein
MIDVSTVLLIEENTTGFLKIRILNRLTAFYHNDKL